MQANATNQVEQGYVLWLTGLSGSGKTTISDILIERLCELGKRVQLLDGDEIRQGLSPELGFSKEDRERHNHRVIFLADMLKRHGIVSVIPVIAPYRAVRDAAREKLGRYIEIYVDTPLEECMRRDPKGLYKKAKDGVIKDMTGLQAPYEPPLNPELVIHTQERTPEECAEEILLYLQENGWLHVLQATAGEV